MTKFTARVQALGRVAIPKPNREEEGIEEGDLVLVEVTLRKKRTGGKTTS